MRNGKYEVIPLPKGTVAEERALYMSSYTTKRWNTYPVGSHSIIFDPEEHLYFTLSTLGDRVGVFLARQRIDQTLTGQRSFCC